MLTMSAILLMLRLLLGGDAQSVEVSATESVWVYPHAGDPTGDEFLRIWGQGGAATPDDPENSANFSFGYLSFDVTKLMSGKPKQATLVLHSVAPATFGSDDVRDTPLEARPLKTPFVATTWSYADVAKVFPESTKSIFGTGIVAGSINGKDSTEIDIDLLKGPNNFSDELAKALSSPEHRLFFALTSSIQANSHGSGGFGGIYKVYSAAAKDKALRPILRLSY